ncbi:hypothetical protein N779_24580 [Vibrio coralliilyticus OCN008]|nr:hypothetical protein N779_24580 [Vibrio coralliilyticus OCN008]
MISNNEVFDYEPIFATAITTALPLIDISS